MKFFTADFHLDHINVIEKSNRPFSSIEEMNEILINNWNSIVSKNDEVYYLGDWALNAKNLVQHLERLNGKIFWIPGNHDDKALKNSDIVKRFEWIKEYHYLKVNDSESFNGKNQSIALFHYPIESWRSMNRETWHLHGHCHGSLPDNLNLKRIDVGIDNPICNYHPFSYDQLKMLMALRKFKPVDHHI